MRLLLPVGLALAVAAPSFAQSRAELAAQNEQLRQRVDRLEARLLTGDPAAERLMARVDTLETTIRTLRGEIERLSYERELVDGEVDGMKTDIRTLQDLATRMKIHLDAVDLVAAQNAPQVDDSYVAGPGTVAQIQGPPTVRTAPFTIPGGETAPADVTALAERGKSLLAEGDYEGAEAALTRYIQGSPDAADLGEAHFWLGESHFVRGQFNTAAESYIAAMRASPGGEKAPDALVKLGASLRELGQTGEACTALQSFGDQFPNAPQAARDKAAREVSRTGC
ncbi:tol-pal system protein YbgF [uncultured Algimonas sp.]|uniref:tol-pal system protein YbgF n=1 Tax=uncultured Algimonas sp. TaxID=1547920 RepID=UPI00263339C4|nr:tol-pal system protein YbgF [uncultured Algimonas sp.]